jgi:hypothetical protein
MPLHLGLIGQGQIYGRNLLFNELILIRIEKIKNPFEVFDDQFDISFVELGKYQLLCHI